MGSPSTVKIWARTARLEVSPRPTLGETFEGPVVPDVKRIVSRSCALRSAAARGSSPDGDRLGFALLRRSVGLLDDALARFISASTVAFWSFG